MKQQLQIILSNVYHFFVDSLYNLLIYDNMTYDKEDNNEIL